MNAAPGFSDHLLDAAFLASTTDAIGFILGILTKYFLVKPAVELLDNGYSR